MPIQFCPCQNNPTVTDDVTHKSYAQCCEPFHIKNELPMTAEQLMRSRYSAFELQQIDYIVATTLPTQQSFLDKQAIAEWAQQTDWQGLEVVQHVEKVGKIHAHVEFKAYFQDPQTMSLQAHHELSAFVQAKCATTKAMRWFFLDPTLSVKVPQKQPCICGSGQKFKRCCGQFI